VDSKTKKKKKWERTNEWRLLLLLLVKEIM
jgi:hypothetical protein